MGAVLIHAEATASRVLDRGGDIQRDYGEDSEKFAYLLLGTSSIQPFSGAWRFANGLIKTVSSSSEKECVIPPSLLPLPLYLPSFLGKRQAWSGQLNLRANCRGLFQKPRCIYYPITRHLESYKFNALHRLPGATAPSVAAAKFNRDTHECLMVTFVLHVVRILWC